MSLPNITWHIKEDVDYVQEPEYYLGSFNSESTIELQIQVWNNKYGQKSIDSIENARLAIYFESIEDSILFNYCTVSVEEGSPIKPTIELNKVVVSIGELSGEPNNGIANDKNRINYKNVKISFKDFPKNLKNGIKNMFLDIEID